MCHEKVTFKDEETESVVGYKSRVKEKGAFPDYITSRLVNVNSVLFNSCELVLKGFFGSQIISNAL